MIELFLCSLITIFPDYLYRRYAQGKRLGSEITLYSVWFELRYGITACIALTVTLITLILYFHPATVNAVSIFRTVAILPEGSGRVEEVYVSTRDKVTRGEPIFKLKSAEQEAAVETARRKLAQVDAAVALVKAQIVVAEAQIREAESAYKQAADELAMKSELRARNASTVSVREIERLQNAVAGRQAGVSGAIANRDTLTTQISTVLPAERSSAESELAQAQVELDKTTVRAGVDGTVEQFTLRQSDIVNPLMRPAGVLIPTEAGRFGLIAGVNQIEAQVIKVGMIAEAACVSKPMTIIPMVVSDVQDLISAGQIRATDVLVDTLQYANPGTVTAYLQPLYEGGFADIPPGSTCLVNAYTSNYDRLDDENLGTTMRLYLHLIDTVGLVHALVLRIQALLLPVNTLIFSGGH